MNNERVETNINLTYGVDDNPTLLQKILLGLQHIFDAFGGIIVVAQVLDLVLKEDEVNIKDIEVSEVA